MPRLALGDRLPAAPRGTRSALAPALACACAAAAALAPRVTHAQAAGDLAIDPFRPAIDSRGYLTINASQPLGHGELSFGLGALSWGRGLLELSSGETRYTVDDVVTATLVAAVGLRLGPAELELGASLPLAILSGDRGPDDPGMPGDPNDDRDYKLDGQGLGNAGLHLKTRLVRPTRGPRIGVGLIASVYLPTASPGARFLGEARAVPQLVGIADRELAGGRLRLAVNAGVRLRSTTTFIDAGDMGAPGTQRAVTASAELPLGAGAAWALAPGRLEVVAEVTGALPLGESESYQPLEAIGGVKVYLARASFLSLGAGRGLLPGRGANPDARAFVGIVFEPSVGDRDGDGLKDDVDRCPAEPEDRDRFEDDDGCPDPDDDRDGLLDRDDRCRREPEDRDGFQDDDGCPEGDPGDRDGDGLLDGDDGCPDDPEDLDGFEDEDGCPDLDNDRDRIPDADDLCPAAPEDADGFEDADGCPDADNDRDRIADRDDRCPDQKEEYNNVDDEDGCPDVGVVVDRRTVLEVLRPIQFEYDSDVIERSSYYILDAVVAALRGNPDIGLVEIAGHTDERGDDAYNLDLSIRRAAAVLRYLTSKGVDPRRLASQGYGETQPLDKRSTPAAYAVNRRVEFLILKRD